MRHVAFEFGLTRDPSRTSALRSRKYEEGFSLLELMVAVGIFSIVAFAAFAMLVATLRAGLAISANVSSQNAFNQVEQQLRAETQTAWAVNVPAADRVDLYFHDAAGDHYVEYFWNGKALLRTSSTQPIGTVHASVSQTIAVDGVTSFAASDITPSALNDPYAPSATQARDVRVPFAGQPPSVQGGNHVVELVVGTATEQHVVDLATATQPSGATVDITFQCAARCALNNCHQFPVLNNPFFNCKHFANKSIDDCSQKCEFWTLCTWWAFNLSGPHSSPINLSVPTNLSGEAIAVCNQLHSEAGTFIDNG